MNYYLVAPAKAFNQSENLLTYQSEVKLSIGQIVLVPFGKQQTVGVIVESTTKPTFATKNITSTVYDEPLPKQLIKALFWLTDYYRCPMSTVVQAILPRGITKKRRTVIESLPKQPRATDNPLNPAQKRAIKAIQQNQANTILLHGITGSGKTNIYIELAKQTLANNQSVIILVPEIALTSQIVRNFRAHFDQISLIHSGQTESLRHQIWQAALQADKPQIVIGPRSALFTPVKNLGLIIIDEAHEPAYQQDQNPKYSALRLASVMAKTILGTATPLISDYYVCKQHDAIVELNQLAIENDNVTTTTIVDLKDRASFTRNRLLSNQLIDSIKQSLATHKQAMIFHNRRGTAPLTICDHCGWQSLCPNCYLPLVLHADSYQMRCHTCGHTETVPTVCPECSNPSIHHKGFGTKYLEQELQKLFPKARIARFDADTDSDQQLTAIYNQVHDGEIDIIVGTQMIAKGFDFPKLSTLGIVQADAGLALPDYSSEERTYELLTQVIGRVTRGHQNTQVFVQTYQPNHPIITLAMNKDYSGLYNYLLQKRKQSSLPPYSFLLKLSLTYKTEKSTVLNARKLYKKIIQNSQKLQLRQVVVTPPMPAFHERSNTGYTWDIVVKAKSRSNLLQLFDSLDKSPYLHFELDPISLL
ncbi:primosomal protein N' [Candidatus Saccharibacteria bacterium]|nr:primosomal protein N' [Candidatus Saccharibacteria bacterium]